jgi:hypothetical protein
MVVRIFAHPRWRWALNDRLSPTTRCRWSRRWSWPAATPKRSTCWGATSRPSRALSTPRTVRARPGRLSALHVSHSKSVLYGVFVWARRALSSQKRRFLARAGMNLVARLLIEKRNRERDKHCPGPPGRLSALSVFLCKSVFYGAFVWAGRALTRPKRRLLARADSRMLANPRDFPQVRTTPSWPRSWANFSLLWLYSDRNTWANLRLLGQPNSFLAIQLHSPACKCCGGTGPPGSQWVGSRLVPARAVRPRGVTIEASIASINNPVWARARRSWLPAPQPGAHSPTRLLALPLSSFRPLVCCHLTMAFPAARPRSGGNRSKQTTS